MEEVLKCKCTWKVLKKSENSSSSFFASSWRRMKKFDKKGYNIPRNIKYELNICSRMWQNIPGNICNEPNMEMSYSQELHS